MKPATISLVSVIATLGTVAAIGFAQPDGIDPPAGPVADTQPSLTSIDEKLDGLLSSSTGLPLNLQVVSLPPLSNESHTVLQNLSGNVRIYSFNTTSGSAELRDSQGTPFADITGGSWRANNQDYVGTNQVMLGGLTVQVPLTVVATSTTPANTRIYYWIEE